MRYEKKCLRSFLLLLLSALLLSGCAKSIPLDTRPPEPWETTAVDRATAQAPFIAGVGRTKIVPSDSLPMGGYGVYFGSLRITRRSEGVHDPLFATAVYFEKGADQLAIIAMDVIGLIKADIDEIRKTVESKTGIHAERVIVTSSHTHHSPDTVGLWGTLLPPHSGRDEAYMRFIKRQAALAVQQAMANRREAVLLAAVGEEKDLHTNIRLETDPDAPIDHTLAVLVLKNAAGEVFGTVTNWACHPTTESAENRLISSDWVHYLRTTLAEKYPHATHMFINGAIGGAILPVDLWRDAEAGANAKPFTWTKNMGVTLGKKVARMVPQAKPVQVDAIDVRFAPVRAYNHNWAFNLARDLKVLAMHVPAEGEVYYSKVTAVKMGSLRIGTLPGEVMPDIANKIRRQLGGETQVLVGLGQDWLGYVVMPEKYDDERYAYEKLLCIGPEFGTNLLKAYAALKFE